MKITQFIRNGIILLFIIVSSFLAIFPPCAQAADVTVTIGSGSGAPGSHHREVEVTLANPSHNVSQLWMFVCDVDNNLEITGVETTDRTSGSSFTFTWEEIEDSPPYDPEDLGCANIQMSGDVLSIGTEPIFTIQYDVSYSATPSECKDLQLEVLSVTDDSGPPPAQLTADEVDGQFCVTSCASNSDCDDGDPCFGDVCAVGKCTYTPLTGNSCGDFCEGDICWVGECKQDQGYPCQPPTLLCTEELLCYCDDDVQCEDDEFCNGEETCNIGTGECLDGVYPCSEPTPLCDEDNDVCYDYDVTIYVEDGESGVIGDRLMWNLGYDKGEEAFTVDATLTGQTSGAVGVIESFTLDTGTWGGDDAEGTLTLVLDDITDTFLDNEIINDDEAPPGSATVNGTATLDYPDPEITVELFNPYDKVKAITMYVCEEVAGEGVDYLEAIPTCGLTDGCSPTIIGCEKIGLPSGFTCSPGEAQPGIGYDGCASILLYQANPSGSSIPQGSKRGILRFKYSVKSAKEGGSTAHINLIPVIEQVIDDYEVEIYGEPVGGEFEILCTADEQCADGLWCNGNEICRLEKCKPGNPPCNPYYCCNEYNDACVEHTGDEDCDGYLDGADNCVAVANYTTYGTCTRQLTPDMVIVIGDICTSDGDCEGEEFCDDNQLDSNENLIGDACECEGDFNSSYGVDGVDFGVYFLPDWLRTDCNEQGQPPCEGDFDGSGGVDGIDFIKFLEDWLRTGCP